MLRRIIGTISIRNGIAVQSIGFKKFLPIGRPEIVVEYLTKWGIDELIINDISPAPPDYHEYSQRVKSLRKKINIPLTIGGHINSTSIASMLFKNGADKININRLIRECPNEVFNITEKFGNQAVIISLDLLKCGNKYKIYCHETGKTLLKNPFDMIKQLQNNLIGELFLQRVELNGALSGFDIPLFRRLKNKFQVPIIASGGAGKYSDFIKIFRKTKVEAAAASNIYNYNELAASIIKHKCRLAGVNVRY